MYKCECFYVNWNDEFVCFYYSGAIVSCRLFDFLVVYMDILNYNLRFILLRMVFPFDHNKRHICTFKFIHLLYSMLILKFVQQGPYVDIVDVSKN